MKDNIKFNWIEQNTHYGLDYPSAKADVGDYCFDIRYDSDGLDHSKKPNCGLVLSVYYKTNRMKMVFGKTIDGLKSESEEIFKTEVEKYIFKHIK